MADTRAVTEAKRALILALNPEAKVHMDSADGSSPAYIDSYLRAILRLDEPRGEQDGRSQREAYREDVDVVKARAAAVVARARMIADAETAWDPQESHRIRR